MYTYRERNNSLANGDLNSQDSWLGTLEEKMAQEALKIANSREEAAKGADIITTDVGVSMGDEKTKERAFEGYFVDTDLIENTGKKSIFLHCLPAHRGQEITFELMEHPSSKVLQQAENRMHVQEALIDNLLS